MMNGAYIVWILLAGCTVAAGGAGEIDRDAALLLLMPQVWEAIHWSPAEGDIQPRWVASTFRCMALCTMLACATSSPEAVNRPPDSKDGWNDSHQDDDCSSGAHQDQHQLLTLKKGWGEQKKKKMLDPLKQNEMEKRWRMTTYPLTGVSKCVMGNWEPAGWPGLGLTPQGLTTVCSASWGENPPSHLSLGTLRYLPNKDVWASAGSLECVEGQVTVTVFTRLREARPPLRSNRVPRFCWRPWLASRTPRCFRGGSSRSRC